MPGFTRINPDKPFAGARAARPRVPIVRVLVLDLSFSERARPRVQQRDLPTKRMPVRKSILYPQSSTLSGCGCGWIGNCSGGNPMMSSTFAIMASRSSSVSGRR